jgi:phage-related protein (TIGR01555 family)
MVKINRYDSLYNALSGMGTNKDKNMMYSIGTSDLGYSYLKELSNDGFFKNILEKFPYFTIKEFIKINNTYKAKEINSLIDSINLREVIFNLELNKRAFGGAVGVIGANDRLEPDKPLQINKVKSLDFINVFNRYEITSTQTNKNIYSKDYNKVEFYIIGNTKIHSSRVIEFNRKSIGTNNLYWGRSWLSEIYPQIINSYKMFQNVSALFDIILTDIFSMDLSDLDDKDRQDLFYKKWETINMSKSIYNSIVMDKSETHTRTQPSFGSIPETIEKNLLQLTAVTKIPFTILFGTQAKGLNNGGDMDIRNFYDEVKSLQELEISKHLDYIFKIFKVVLGLKEDIEWEFNPLYIEDTTTKANNNKTEVETLDKLLLNEIIDKNEYRSLIVDRYGLK